jgi:hypothetical protein
MNHELEILALVILYSSLAIAFSRLLLFLVNPRKP